MSNFDKHVLAFFPTIYTSGQFKDYRVLENKSISDTLLGEKDVISFRDHLGLSNECSYDVNDVISWADRFGFQNFCSPAANRLIFKDGLIDILIIPFIIIITIPHDHS